MTGTIIEMNGNQRGSQPVAFGLHGGEAGRRSGFVQVMMKSNAVTEHRSCSPRTPLRAPKWAIVVRRLPFTAGLISAMLMAAVLTGALTHDLTRSTTLAHFGYGLPALERGEFDTLLTSIVVALSPRMLATIAFYVTIFVVPYEWVAGTSPAAIIFLITQSGGYVLTSLAAWVLGALQFGWGDYLAATRDVGASAGAFGCAGALLWSLPVGWRRPATLALAGGLAILLLFNHRIWDLEHALATPLGYALDAWLSGRRSPVPRSRGFSVPRSAPRIIVALLVMLAGLSDVLLVLGVHFSTRIVSWERGLPFALLHGTRTFVALAGIFLILLGRGLLHGRRTAWIAAIGLLAGSTFLHLVRGIDIAHTIVGLGLIAVLLWRQRDFRARPDVLTAGRAIRIALASLALLPLYAALGFALMRHGFTEPVTASAAARETLARMLFTTSGGLAGATRHARWFLDSITFIWAAVLGFGVLEILRPVLHPTVETARDRWRALALLRRYGTAAMSYMTTWPGNTLLLNGQGDAYVAYRLIGPVALVLGDPVGSPDGCPRAIDEFVDLAATNGWTPCFYGVTSCYLREYERHGLAALPIGEDTVIDLPSLEFRGKQWQDVRTAINRARRAGISFRMISQVEADPAITRQLREISDAWIKDRGLPEMDFTIGRLTDPPDPEVRTAIAIDQEGRVQGFITWLPVYAGHGWVIDLLRRREDAFRGIMEFLIAESASVFKAERAHFISLGAAPLARASRDGSDDGVLENVLDLLSGWLNTFYHFGSLYEFKRKFSPHWEPIFLIYPGAASLPRVGYALLRAYLPDLSRDDVRSMITDAIDALPRPWPFTRSQGRECAASDPHPGQAPQGSEPEIESRQLSAPATWREPGDDQ